MELDARHSINLPEAFSLATLEAPKAVISSEVQHRALSLITSESSKATTSAAIVQSQCLSHQALPPAHPPALPPAHP